MVRPIIEEQGIPVGNVYDKYATGNPIARRLVRNFISNVLDLVRASGARDIHEVGCGEGYLTEIIAALGVDKIRGSDMSEKMIAEARSRTAGSGLVFESKNIYELGSDDSAELIVCCEVLEHLDDPEGALQVLALLNTEHYVFSVPREPIWRVLNLARGKYLGQLGNTPGHLQHWSAASFQSLIGRYFDVSEKRSPLPWTMLLCRRRER